VVHVQPGVDEQLEDDGDFVAVARVNRKARGMAATRALAVYGNSGAINAELRCMGVNPFERGVIVHRRTTCTRTGRSPARLGQPIKNRSAKAMNRAADMNVQEKSDCAVIPVVRNNCVRRPHQKTQGAFEVYSRM